MSSPFSFPAHRPAQHGISLPYMYSSRPLAVHDGRQMNLPPTLRAFRPAQHGINLPVVYSSSPLAVHCATTKEAVSEKSEAILVWTPKLRLSPCVGILKKGWTQS